MLCVGKSCSWRGKRSHMDAVHSCLTVLRAVSVLRSIERMRLSLAYAPAS